MFRSRFCNSFCAAALMCAMLACPCGVWAQRGGAGRNIGGGSEVVGGLDNLGKPTGVAVKDDLKDFHEALAVQASSQQAAEFSALQKSTALARAQLQAWLAGLGKEPASAAGNARAAAFFQELETVQSGTAKFLDGLSERQKVGLKEMIRRVTKANFDLAQSGRDAHSTAGGAPALLSLDHLLENLQSEEVGLGEEMGIGDFEGRGGVFHLPAVKNSVVLADKAVAIPVSGMVSQGTASGLTSAPQTFTVELTADFSGVQENMTGFLRAQLDREERCGERIAIQSATLAPLAPASVAVAQLHYERWSCFGRDANEIAEGAGTMEVELNPAVGEGGELRLLAKVRRVDANGLVGELLRSGSLGDAVRDTMRDTVLSAARQGGDFNAMLPSAAQGHAKLQRTRFQAVGSGRLMVVFDGEIQVSSEAAVALVEELKARNEGWRSYRAGIRGAKCAALDDRDGRSLPRIIFAATITVATITVATSGKVELRSTDSRGRLSPH